MAHGPESVNATLAPPPPSPCAPRYLEFDMSAEPWNWPRAPKSPPADPEMREVAPVSAPVSGEPDAGEAGLDRAAAGRAGCGRGSGVSGAGAGLGSGFGASCSAVSASFGLTGDGRA